MRTNDPPRAVIALPSMGQSNGTISETAQTGEFIVAGAINFTSFSFTVLTPASTNRQPATGGVR